MSKQKHTTGQLPDVLSQLLGRKIPLHRVLYAIRARGIQPIEIVGRYRLFDEEAVNQLAAELA